LIIIGLAGLHRAGKSFFRNSQIPRLYGYSIVNKKELIIKLCRDFYSSKNIDLDEIIKNKIINSGLDLKNDQFLDLFNNLIWEFSNEWYEEHMYNNTHEVLFHLVKLANEIYGPKIVLDAVHNNLEWAVISEYVDKKGIIYFSTPKTIRESRPGVLDNDIVNKKNIKRIGYWFKDNSVPNLINGFSWCIDGTEDILKNNQSFALLDRCIEKDIDLYDVDLLTLKSKLENDYTICNYKSEIIDDLCEEINSSNQDNESLCLKLIKEKHVSQPCYGLKK